MSPIYISTGRVHRFEYKLEDYPNVNPAFLYNPDISKEERIRAMVEKLPTLSDIPKELCPKDSLKKTILPPMFYFGIPITLKSFFDLARKFDFDGYPRYDQEPVRREPSILQSRRRLRKKMYEMWKVDIDPEYQTVYLNASKHTDLLCFYCSYDGPEYPLPPKELSERIRSLFELDQDLKWYIDSKLSDWRIGRLTLLNVGHVRKEW